MHIAQMYENLLQMTIVLLPRDAMPVGRLYAVVVCPFVCLSQVGVLLKPLGGSSSFLAWGLPSTFTGWPKKTSRTLRNYNGAYTLWGEISFGTFVDQYVLLLTYKFQ